MVIIRHFISFIEQFSYFHIKLTFKFFYDNCVTILLLQKFHYNHRLHGKIGIIWSPDFEHLHRTQRRPTCEAFSVNVKLGAIFCNLRFKPQPQYRAQHWAAGCRHRKMQDCKNSGMHSLMKNIVTMFNMFTHYLENVNAMFDL